MSPRNPDRRRTHPPKPSNSTEFRMDFPRSKSSSSLSSSSSSSSSSSTPSPSSSFSSCFSSTHSTFSTHSINSSSNSTSVSLPNSPARCEGLDLLVKAMYHVVAGSAVAVPYIQRRVIRRRKRAVRFSNLVFRNLAPTEIENHGDGEIDMELAREGEKSERKIQAKKRRTKTALAALPSRYGDSPLHQWRPPRSRQARSGKIRVRSGF